MPAQAAPPLPSGTEMAIIKAAMARRRPYTLVYANVTVKEHLRAIDAKYHSVIQSVVQRQLLHEPNVETRNRKPLQRPVAFGADWELRLGPANRFRVFYQVNPES